MAISTRIFAKDIVRTKSQITVAQSECVPTGARIIAFQRTIARRANRSISRGGIATQELERVQIVCVLCDEFIPVGSIYQSLH